MVTTVNQTCHSKQGWSLENNVNSSFKMKILLFVQVLDLTCSMVGENICQTESYDYESPLDPTLLNSMLDLEVREGGGMPIYLQKLIWDRSTSILHGIEYNILTSRAGHFPTFLKSFRSRMRPFSQIVLFSLFFFQSFRYRSVPFLVKERFHSPRSVPFEEDKRGAGLK